MQSFSKKWLCHFFDSLSPGTLGPGAFSLFREQKGEKARPDLTPAPGDGSIMFCKREERKEYRPRRQTERVLHRLKGDLGWQGGKCVRERGA